MSKVKVNEFQKRHLDYFIKKYGEGEIPASLTVSLEKLADAIKYGYEVEPEFKVGDWLAYDKTNGGTIVVEIIAVTGKVGGIECFILGEGYGKKAKTMVNTHYRHATPSEIAEEKDRRFFARHGRKSWEIREGDILEYLGDLLIVDSFDSEDVCFKRSKGSIDDYFENSDYVKEHFKVVCFIDGRLDVKTNE